MVEQTENVAVDFENTEMFSNEFKNNINKNDQLAKAVPEKCPILKQESMPLLYSVDDKPSWGLSFTLGVQQYLTMVGGIISVPFILGAPLCILADDPSRGYLISTIFMVSGIATFIQSTYGIRLPIVQGSSFAYIVCTLAILQLPTWKCPPDGELYAMGQLNRTHEWQTRMLHIQGAIIVSAITEMLIGYCGLLGLILRYITPLTITPTIALVGLSMFSHGASLAAGNWYISFSAIGLVVLFSQYLRHVDTPLLTYNLEKGWHWRWIKGFQLFPVLLTTIIVYMVCYWLTKHEVLDTTDPGRTDLRQYMVENSQWFRIPYPFQWGWPTFSTSSSLAMMAAVIAGVVESVGDYYACARICGKSPPPISVMSRGIGTEGVGCFIAGLFGIGTGITSFSENIGAIGVTRIASRRVVQCGSVFIIVLACFGKLGAMLATIPTPVIGGLLCVMFSMVTAVGLSNIQYIDMNSPRNLFVLGASLFFGVAIPEWIKLQPDAIDTGILAVDQFLKVLLSTHMFLGGMIGFVLDNTVPGSKKERGVLEWRRITVKSMSNINGDVTYNLPQTFSNFFKNRSVR